MSHECSPTGKDKNTNLPSLFGVVTWRRDLQLPVKSGTADHMRYGSYSFSNTGRETHKNAGRIFMEGAA